MIRGLNSVGTLVLGAAGLLAACATSDDATGGAGGSGATGGVSSGGSSGSGGAAGSGGASGSAGSGGGAGAAGAGGTDAGTGGTDAGTGGTDAGTGGADAGDGGGKASISGRIVGLLAANPIAGLKVCVYQTPSIPCVQTDSAGDYTLPGVPLGQEILLEYTKSGYLPVLVTVRTATSAIDVGKFLAPTTTEADSFAGLVGTTIDPQKGQLLFTAFMPGSSGGWTGQDNVVGSITPKSGTGPYYLSTQNLPDLSLKATSATGIGLFANVDPGDIDVALTHFTKTCKRFSTSWVGAAASSSKVKVVAGYLTGGAALDCP